MILLNRNALWGSPQLQVGLGVGLVLGLGMGTDVCEALKPCLLSEWSVLILIVMGESETKGPGMDVPQNLLLKDPYT